MRIINAFAAFGKELISGNKKQSTRDYTMAELLEIFHSETSAGVSITESSSMTIPAVYSCVRLLAETLASIPLLVYRRDSKGGKYRENGHSLYPILHDQPNPFMTSFTFRETLMAHVSLWGNAYAEIERDGNGDVKHLWPLNPTMTEPEITKNGTSIYRTVIDGKGFVIPGENILHIPGLSFDGLKGKSVIKWASESLGLSKAIEKYGNMFFGRGGNPSGILKSDKKMTDDEKKRLKISWNEAHEGLSRQFRVAVLDQTLNWQQIGINPEDSQALETRKYSRSEIASMFRVPPHMIGDLERATFSNIEHQSIEFAIYTIRPWAVRFEQAQNAKLFFDSEKSEYFTEYLLDGLLRGDAKSRADAYHIMRQDGILCADEWRALENMNPIEDGSGKKFLINGNMIDTASAKKIDERIFLPILNDVLSRIRSREDRDIERLSKKKEFQENFRGISDVIESEVYAEPWVDGFLEPVLLSISIASERQIDISELRKKIIAKTKEAVEKSNSYAEFRNRFLEIKKEKELLTIGDEK